jgi:biopolymer transport protein ExbD
MIKTPAVAVAAFFLFTTTSQAQISPPPTPVLPCDATAIMGARSVPPLTLPTVSGSASDEQRPTSVIIAFDGVETRFFVTSPSQTEVSASDEVPIAQLGQAVGNAWALNSAGASIDQCWNGNDAGEYSVGGRSTSICTIMISANDTVRYHSLSSVRNALRNAGFTKFALIRGTPDGSDVVFDYHVPLNPVPIALQGLHPTNVRLTSRPDADHPVITIAEGGGWTELPLTQLGDGVTRAAIRDNPALSTEQIHTDARICVRPDSAVSYGDIIQIITAIRNHGFRRVGLYSEAVVAIADQNH